MPDERKPRVLVVDDQLAMAETLCDGLLDHGFEAVAIGSGRKAAALLLREPFDALVTDLRMPDLDGLSLLAQSRRAAPERPVLIMTAHGAIDSAIESIRQGAAHYLTKPFKLEELVIFLNRALDEARVRREASALRATLRERNGRTALIGQSPAMRPIFDLLDRVAVADVPLLIGGETGTGKSLFARVVHAEGVRAAGPFVSLNCGALPENLLESELFGHEKGAFTGAAQARKGLLAEADGGILFLDEIGDLPPALQVKLLHVLEEGVVRPVGANRPHKVNVRILAATHCDLREAVKAGKFREDLYYRLDVISVSLPALRNRREDIPLLVAHFLRELRSRHPQSPVRRVSREALQRLVEYDWPGNVRELSHVLERVVVLGRSEEVGVADLPGSMGRAGSGPSFDLGGEILPIRTVQRRYAAWVLSQLGGHRGQAAEKLGVDVKTLYNWLSEDKSEPDKERKAAQA
jgi:two-component system response regulator HydG